MSLQKITMSSGGAYSLATRGAEDVINAASPLVKNAFSEMNIPPDQKDFTFSDMGCADGATLMTTPTCDGTPESASLDIVDLLKGTVGQGFRTFNRRF